MRLLVVDTTFEPTRAPVHKLNSALVLDNADSLIDGTGSTVTTVQETGGHVLSMTGVALGQHVVRFKNISGNFSQGKVFMGRLFRRNKGRVRRDQHVQTRVGDQVGGEFRNIDIQRTVETKRRRKRRNHLGNHTIQVRVTGSGDSKFLGSHFIQRFIVKQHSTIRVLQKRMCGQDTVVRFHHGRTDFRTGANGKTKLGFASVIHAQTFQKETTKTRSSTTPRGMKDQKALQSGALIGQLTDTIHDLVNQLLTDSVVTTSVVIGGIFGSSNDLSGMVQGFVFPSTNFITDTWFQIHK
mmetsp:Transcript_18966/g.24414  ORF Transcript_18966/g.24414 Transcript_18966/m.24414 type:complete len:296 (+) Transcript_18966:410-1297(+)